jgi:hypothetical protein
MCRYLDPACFMANVFTACASSSTMDFVTLRKVRDHVVYKLAAQDVVIEWTRESVFGALECYSDLFSAEDGTVKWMGSEDREAVKTCFDSQFTPDFVVSLQDAIREGCRQASGRVA